MDDSAPNTGQLHEPEFRSSIPAHVLAKLSDREQAQIHALSALEARLNWITTVLRYHHRSVYELTKQSTTHGETLGGVVVQSGNADRQLTAMSPKVDELMKYKTAQEALDINAKTVSLWDWKSNFTGKIALLYVIGAAVASMLLKFLGDTVMYYMGHKP